MNFWILLWKVVLIAGVTMFSGMAIWVTIGGLFDIKRLFTQIEQNHKKEEKNRDNSDH